MFGRKQIPPLKEKSSAFTQANPLCFDNVSNAICLLIILAKGVEGYL